jgi:hypothetical protein
MGSRGHKNEILGFTKEREFAEQLNDYWFL